MLKLRSDWLVPGLLKEKVVALFKTLPQKYRHRLQPVDASAEAFCDAEHDTDEPLVKSLTRFVEERIALKLPLDAFRPGELRPHLLMNFRLVDEHGGTLAMSRNFAELRAEYGEFAEPSEEKAATLERDELRDRFAQALKEQVKYVEKSLPRELGLLFLPLGTEKELKDQIVAAALDRTGMEAPLPATQKEFEVRAAAAKGKVTLVAQEIARLVGAVTLRPAFGPKGMTDEQLQLMEFNGDIVRTPEGGHAWNPEKEKVKGVPGPLMVFDKSERSSPRRLR